MSEKKYWTTQEQLERTPDYLKLKDEEFFVKPAEDMEEGGQPSLGRRNFITATGAASVFLAATGCRDPEKKVIPYHAQPEELIPGNPIYYSSIDGSGENGLLVKTHEGRPIRVDGNPHHAVNAGKLDAVGNASIIDLYDPDRIRHPGLVTKGKIKKASWAGIYEKTANELKIAGSGALWVTRPIHGKAQQQLAREFLKAFPGMQHIEVDPTGSDHVAASQQACYGKYEVPVLRYDQAKVIVSLGYDFLSESPNAIETARRFAQAKRVKNGHMARVVTFEPYLSMTGANSDERFRVRPSQLADIASALAAKILMLKGSASELMAKSLDVVEKECHLTSGSLQALAEELFKHKGESLVVAGGSVAQSAFGEALLNAVNLINSVLGNDGVTVGYGDGALLHVAGTPGAIEKISQLTSSGKAKAILFQDVDLLYLAGKNSGLAEALSKVPFRAGLFSHMHRTAQACQMIMPTLHTLESWNDAEPRKGLYALGQPTIKPLWDNKARQDSLLALIKQVGGQSTKDNWHDFIKDVWSKQVYNGNVLAAGFEDFWKSALREGVYDPGAESRERERVPRVMNPAAIKSIAASKGAVEGDEVVLHRTAMHGTGESMNNPWLLEAPDAISKISWDNYASVSMATAKKKGYKEGQILSIRTEAGSLEVPVHVQPGVADGVYAVSLGWGNPEIGHVAKGPEMTSVGSDASSLAPAVNGVSVYAGIKIKKIKNTGRSTTLACVQGHQYLTDSTMRATGEENRKVVQDTTIEEFNHGDPHGWQIPYHAPTNISMWRKQFPYAKRKWQMVIDTNTCTGCNACTISCQAENNIPCVGKDEIIINREMHWMRIDRYYTPKDGDYSKVENSDEVDVINQPLPCQHCDNAPCEIVCPVLATTHSEEGVNTQTYNRCVGTRYCANNCPYKVRRYNWYDYTEYRAGLHGSGNPLRRFLRSLNEDIDDKLQYPLMMQFNPDVTVRSRGVMEKCNFCVHKIRRWNTDEAKLGRTLPESEKQTACQQACPADAISFGNILDKTTRVHKETHQKGAYKVLAELNAQPAVTYLTKLRNRKPVPKADGGHGQSHGESHGEHSSHEHKKA